MLFNRTLALTLLLLGGPAAAFNIGPSGGTKGKTPSASAATKNIATIFTAGVIGAAAILPSSPAMAADSLVLGTPLEAKLAQFGAASYPVFNSVSDVTPLADKFIDFIEKKVKPADAGAVAEKAVDGLLAIPDNAITEYKGVLKQVVYSGVNPANCVTLAGSGVAGDKLFSSSFLKAVPPSKMDALKKKFSPANSSVPKKGGDICLPGSVAASEKLWVAQAELTFNMPKAEAGALISSIKKAGASTPRSALASLVPAAEGVFSKNPEALKMVTAGKEVEPFVISFSQAAAK